ncbi:MAG: hypothetical protein PUE95_05275 [Lachnospiraceae bacterium]|nr:hypothetical protein [Lachnospiraceae bacterium]
MNNKKRFPLILMLIAGAVVSIILYIKNYELIKFLWILLASLVVFYAIGRIVVSVIDRFDRENEEANEEANAEDEDGAVIEKETVPEEQDM